MHACLFAGAVADFRDHGRNRHDADWKDAAPNEMVQETTLAGLESSQHGNADLVLSRRCSCAGEKAGESRNLVARRHVRCQVQGRLEGRVGKAVVGLLAGTGGMPSSVYFGVNVSRPQNHSSSRVGAIIPEAASRRLMAGSITNGLNQIIASFQGVRLLLGTEIAWEAFRNNCIGEPGGTRTRDHLIKSQMLYQLSYRPSHTCVLFQLTTPPRGLPAARDAKMWSCQILSS